MCHDNKIVPRVYLAGGKVKASDKNIPAHILKKGDPDRVLARLMPGEIVIPVKHASYVNALYSR